MEPSDRRSTTRYDRSRSTSSIRGQSRSRPRELSFSRSPSLRGRPPRRHSRSRGRSPSSSSYYSSSSSSRSRSRSQRRSSRSRARAKRSEKRSEEKGGAIAAIKSAAPLLATIGVASVVAHKFWPKGVLFGDKEDWETRKVVERRSRTVEKDEHGAVRRARSVTQTQGGDLVVDHVVRRSRRDHSFDAAHDRDRRYARPPPPPPPSYPRQPERPHVDERYRPSSVNRYQDRYQDRRYEERPYRPRSYVDERGYDERNGGRW